MLGLRTALRASHVLYRPATRAFTAGTPLLNDAEAPPAEVVQTVNVDKENPLYAPDSLQSWRNAGYSNLAPAGWTEWEDLPAPYKYYGVKVDPADVEKPGMLWNLFTKWQTGIPLVTLLSLPAFVYDVVLIDERFELMLIFWTTMAVVNASAGDGIRKGLESSIDAIRTQLTTAESKFTGAVDQAIDSHKKASHVASYLGMINAGERQLRALEVAAEGRQSLINTRDRTEAMLDYLVMVKDSKAAAVSDVVTGNARAAVEAKLASDKALQQKTVDNAIAALKASKTSDDVVETLFASEYAAAQAAADKALAESSGVTQTDRDLFARRFGLHDTVTEADMEAAAASPQAMALLAYHVGGTPSVGAKIKMAIDY